MPKYFYEAQTAEGQRVSGEITALRVTDAIIQLESQGMDVESIRAVHPPVFASVEPSKEREEFYQRIDAAIEDRDAIVVAIDALASDMAQQSSARELHKLAGQLRSGVKSEQLFEQHDLASWLPLVVRGLGSTSANNRFEQLIEDASRESDNRRNLSAVFAYPAFLFGLASLVLLFILIVVVPTFSEMFRDFGLRLPAPTLMVVWLSNQVVGHPLRSAMVLLIGSLGMVTIIRLWFKLALTTRVLGIFTSGNSINVTAMSRFVSTLAELLSLDAPLFEAIRIAGRACKHRHFRLVANQLASEIQTTGGGLSRSSVAHNFPPTVRYALAVGEGGRPNVRLLRQLAQVYSDRAGMRTTWSTSIFGPLSIIVIGFIVFVVVASLFMPLISMVSSLS